MSVRLEKFICVTVLIGFSWPVVASEEALALLKRAADAARTLNYLGIVVYQQGAQTEASKIIHYVDESGQYEKLVSLDGPAREVIRTDQHITCYYSDIKTVRVEERANRRTFPALSAAQQKTLTEHYFFKKGELGRVAGLEAQEYIFLPKDSMRYGHKLWSDRNTGLLLKVRMLNEKGEIVEQFAFTTIQIGGKIDKEMAQPSYPARPADWQYQSMAQEKTEQQTGWMVKRIPPGFNKIKEAFRRMSGKHEPVAHLVFSDGLVAVSVFVEPLSSTPRQLGLTQQGAINIFSRQWDNYLITALGEAPGITVRQIATSVARR